MAHEPKPQEPGVKVDVAADGAAQELAEALLQALAKPAPVQTSRQKRAGDRAGRDIQAATDSARAATQAALLINGGAATAVLAYLSKDAQTALSLLSAASWSLMAYAVGVFCGAASMWCSAQASATFGHYWDATADQDKAGQDQFTKSGERWLCAHRVFFILSVVSFIGSSFWIALAFLQVAHGAK